MDIHGKNCLITGRELKAFRYAYAHGELKMEKFPIFISISEMSNSQKKGVHFYRT